MRAFEFLTEPENRESAVAETAMAADANTGLDRRIAAKKRTIALRNPLILTFVMNQ